LHVANRDATCLVCDALYAMLNSFGKGNQERDTFSNHPFLSLLTVVCKGIGRNASMLCVSIVGRRKILNKLNNLA
jgi:hypothetical protein